MRESILAGVEAAWAGQGAQQLHESWCAERQAIGGIVAGVLVAFGVVTEAQGIAVAPLITVVAAFAQNWRG
jgi:uncharacterized membrane protein YphA (DoxX/SURF4 family)